MRVDEDSLLYRTTDLLLVARCRSRTSTTIILSMATEQPGRAQDRNGLATGKRDDQHASWLCQKDRAMASSVEGAADRHPGGATNFQRTTRAVRHVTATWYRRRVWRGPRWTNRMVRAHIDDVHESAAERRDESDSPLST